jgi:hypothetical protein
MICKELDRLDLQLIKNRNAQRKPDLTDKERQALLPAEIGLNDVIKEHQSAGHGGQQRCPGLSAGCPSRFYVWVFPSRCFARVLFLSLAGCRTL